MKLVNKKIATLKDLLNERELKFLKVRNIEECTEIRNLTVLDLFNLMCILDESDKYNSQTSIQTSVLETLTKRALLAQKPIF